MGILLKPLIYNDVRKTKKKMISGYGNNHDKFVSLLK